MAAFCLLYVVSMSFIDGSSS